MIVLSSEHCSRVDAESTRVAIAQLELPATRHLSGLFQRIASGTRNRSCRLLLLRGPPSPGSGGAKPRGERVAAIGRARRWSCSTRCRLRADFLADCFLTASDSARCFARSNSHLKRRTQHAHHPCHRARDRRHDLIASAGACRQPAVAVTPAGRRAPSQARDQSQHRDVDQLETLPGIGRKTAERIIEYRTKAGGFKRIEDLMNVKGIGEKSFLKLKPLVAVPPKTDKAPVNERVRLAHAALRRDKRRRLDRHHRLHSLCVLMASIAVPVIGGTLERERTIIGAQYLAGQLQRARLDSLRRRARSPCVCR
jgi:competence protein ComEA